MSSELNAPGTPVKVFAFVTRTSSMTEEAFHDYWRDVHGDLFRRTPLVERYVQSHRVAAPVIEGLESPYDGVAEMWFENLEGAVALGDNPDYVRYAVPDEARFLELGSDAFRVLTREDVVLQSDGARTDGSVKLVQGIRRAAGLSVDAFHGLIAREAELQLADELGATRAVLCRALAENYGVQYVPFDGTRHAWLTGDPFDAIREMTWPSVAAFVEAVRNHAMAWDRLMRSAYMDAHDSSAFLAREHVVVEPGVLT
jgi:uncharacterized protein (TIGR02118 family)